MSQAEGDPGVDLETTLDSLRLEQMKTYVSQAEKILPSSIGFNKTDSDFKSVKGLTQLANVFCHTKPASPTPGGVLASKLESELRVLKKKNYLNDLKSEIVNLESKQMELDSLKEDICRNSELTKSVFDERKEKTNPVFMERTARTLASYQIDLSAVKDRCDVFVNKNLPSMEDIDRSLSKLESLQEEKDTIGRKLQVFTSVPLDIQQAQALLNERKQHLESLGMQITSYSSTTFE